MGQPLDMPENFVVPSASRLTLVAVSGEQTFSWPLPGQGQVTLGSDPGCECPIDHPSVSARHAVIRVGVSLEIEELGSDRGSQLRGHPLRRGTPEPLNPGEAVMLGDVIIIVQNRVGGLQRRIWTHGYFESRVEEECLRAERNASSFAVVRLHCPPQTPAERVEECLADVLRLVDVVGIYGPGEYEAILLDTQPEGAGIAAQRLGEKISARVASASVGFACFPLDGRDADSLMATAGGRARGETSLPGEPLSVVSGMEQIHLLVERIATTDINVLILGETGVGKERLAELIHRRSPRAQFPLLGLNVTALTDSLLESELFGHERGAFTGAVQAKPGLLETADGGTVLLDEVGEMPMATQAKLLRVLETRQVLRVGGIKARTINVRFVAATNRDLEAEVVRGTFRQDLYYRLNGMSFVLPPLRERVEEIEGLATSFIEESAKKYHRPTPALSAAALALMRRYAWPGNIRELRNAIERAVVVCTADTIGLEHLPVEKMSAGFAARTVTTPPRTAGDARAPVPAPLAPSPVPSTQAVQDLRDEVRTLERKRIIDALAASAGNQTEAARMLGMSRRTLINRLGTFGLPRPRGRKSGRA